MEDHGLHNEIMRALGRLEGKVDGILVEQKKTNGRVSTLEGKMSDLSVMANVNKAKLGIMASAAGTIGGLIITWVLK